MADDNAPDRRPDELVSVLRWRQAVLADAGYPPEEAYVLAGREDVDLHRAVGLLADGCPLKYALRILL